MKYILLFLGIAFSFTSCDKNKDFPRYTSLYHIDGNDTISTIHIPNSFTPDGDGINDGFKIYIYGIDSATVIIYNKVGEEFYYTRFIDYYGWDGTHKGTVAENGSYHFVLNAKDSTGFIYNYEGVVELVK